MYVDDDKEPTFRIVGSYSADHVRSKYPEVYMTANFDHCARIALKKGVSNNPKAEAANALKVAGITQDDPFDGADPFNPGKPKSEDPFDTSGTGAGNDAGSVNPSGVTSWEDTTLIPTNNAAIDSRLFAASGNHTIRPNNFNSLCTELPLTLSDAKDIYKIAQKIAPTESTLTQIRRAGGAMRGCEKAWTKTSFSGSISAAQNKDRADYDYFAVCTAFMNAAMQFYGHVGRFTVVPSS